MGIEDKVQQNNSNATQIPEQPWKVELQDLDKIGNYTFDDFVIECSMRLFASTNLDMYGAKDVNVVVKECVDRSMLLAEQLHNRLSNKSDIYWRRYKGRNQNICENFCNQDK